MQCGSGCGCCGSGGSGGGGDGGGGGNGGNGGGGGGGDSRAQKRRHASADKLSPRLGKAPRLDNGAYGADESRAACSEADRLLGALLGESAPPPPPLPPAFSHLSRPADRPPAKRQRN